MAGKETKIKSRGLGAGVLALLVLFSFGMIVVFQLGFIFFLMAMLPTVVAFYVDTGKQQTTFHTVLACNLAGVLPFLGKMLDPTSNGKSAATIMTDAFSWLLVYTSAGMGWVLVFSIPIAAEFFVRSMHQRQVSRLERVQRRIVEEWGEDVGEIRVKEAPKNKK